MPNAVGFISLKAVQAQFIFFCEDGDGFFSHLIGRSHYADRNFTTVCYKDFLKIRHVSTLRSLNKWPYKAPCCPVAMLQRSKGSVKGADADVKVMSQTSEFVACFNKIFY